MKFANRLRIWGVIVGIAVTMLAGCGGAQKAEGEKQVVDWTARSRTTKLAQLSNLKTLLKFKAESENKNIVSDKEILDFYKDAISTAFENKVNGLGCYYDYVMADATSSPTTGDVPVTSTEEISYTDTNVQEVTVGEDDLIKTNGKHVFAIIGNKIVVAKSWPVTSLEKLAELTFTGTPKGMHLVKNTLIVITEDAGGFKTHLYNVATPESPQLIREDVFSGTLITTRIFRERLYLISTSDLLEFANLKLNWPILDCADETKQEANKKIIETFRSDGLIIIESLTAEKAGLEKISNFYVGSNSSAENILKITRADLGTSANIANEYLLSSNGGTVYMSQNHIFIGESVWITCEESEPNCDEDFTEPLAIHSFSIASEGPAYESSIIINGHFVSNNYVGSIHSQRFSMSQFAMSEHEGVLRAAVTVGEVWGGNATAVSGIYLIDTTLEQMDMVSSVGNIGKGEKIHAIRFVADKGYVVTFKKTDPLYVIDLSNPNDPKIAGELKIPGFSTYLHPIEGNRLIGLGFGADDQGNFAWTQGIKLSLFDISDPANPKEIGNRILGSRGSYSPAAEEHHAFTFDPERMLIALPVELTEGASGGSTMGTKSFNGVMVMKVDETGKFPTVKELAIDTDNNSSYWINAASILRTIITGGSESDAATGIVTLTDESLLMHNLGSGEEVGIIQ